MQEGESQGKRVVTTYSIKSIRSPEVGSEATTPHPNLRPVPGACSHQPGAILCPAPVSPAAAVLGIASGLSDQASSTAHPSPVLLSELSDRNSECSWD